MAVSLKAKKVLKELEERHKKNFDYIVKKYYPLYEVILSKKGKLDVSIDIKNNGEINLLVGSNPVLPTDRPLEFYKKQFEDFVKDPGFLTISALPSNVDGYDGVLHFETTKKFSQLPIYSKIDRNSLVLDMKTMPLVIIFGLGLGYHLQWLVEKFDVYHIIVVDIDFELIKPSLYTINWKKILDSITSKKGSISFIVETENPLDGIMALVNKIKQLHPAFGTYAFVYEHYENDFINLAKDYLKDRYSEVIQGFGFFDDEIWAVEHTYGNIKNKIPVYYGNYKVGPDTMPAFIVASGPSLDETIDLVKEHKDKAVIFSCGTALKRLMKEGIVPDFHVEIERTKDTYDKLMYQYDEEYFKNLFLTAASNVYPDTFLLTGKSAMFLKGGDSGMLFFENVKNIERLEPVNPTVTNGATMLALSMGFRELYFFGTDFGFVNPKKHHASKTVYEDKDFFAYKEEFENYFEVKGNFRETVYTEPIYNYSRIVLESQLSVFKNAGLKAFNLSDGAYINGTTPLKKEDFKLETPKYTKQEVLEFLYKNFRTDYLEIINPEESLKKYVEESKKTADQLIELHQKLYQVKDKPTLIQTLTEINHYIMNLPLQQHTLFRGSLWHFHTYIYNTTFRIVNSEDFLTFIKDATDIVLEFLEKSKKTLDKIYSVC
ncbi:MAG: motility associated factor glycosyltransferase family protein [Sulfurihydrogenibium sp.]